MPGTSGIYPVTKVKVTWHVAKTEDQPVSRFQIPLVPPGLSTTHVAQVLRVWYWGDLILDTRETGSTLVMEDGTCLPVEM